MNCAEGWKELGKLKKILAKNPKDPNARARLEAVAAHCVGTWADEGAPGNPYYQAKELLIELESHDPEIDPELAERVRRARKGRDDWGRAP